MRTIVIVQNGTGKSMVDESHLEHISTIVKSILSHSTDQTEPYSPQNGEIFAAQSHRRHAHATCRGVHEGRGFHQGSASLQRSTEVREVDFRLEGSTRPTNDPVLTE